MKKYLNLPFSASTLKLKSYYILTLSDAGRGGQKGNKWECFQKISTQKVHFPHGLMEKALDFDTKGP